MLNKTIMFGCCTLKFGMVQERSAFSSSSFPPFPPPARSDELDEASLSSLPASVTLLGFPVFFFFNAGDSCSDSEARSSSSVSEACAAAFFCLLVFRGVSFFVFFVLRRAPPVCWRSSSVVVSLSSFSLSSSLHGLCLCFFYFDFFCFCFFFSFFFLKRRNFFANIASSPLVSLSLESSLLSSSLSEDSCLRFLPFFFFLVFLCLILELASRRFIRDTYARSTGRSINLVEQ